MEAGVYFLTFLWQLSVIDKIYVLEAFDWPIPKVVQMEFNQGAVNVLKVVNKSLVLGEVRVWSLVYVPKLSLSEPWSSKMMKLKSWCTINSDMT